MLAAADALDPEAEPATLKPPVPPPPPTLCTTMPCESSPAVLTLPLVYTVTVLAEAPALPDPPRLNPSAGAALMLPATLNPPSPPPPPTLCAKRPSERAPVVISVPLRGLLALPTLTVLRPHRRPRRHRPGPDRHRRPPRWTRRSRSRPNRRRRRRSGPVPHANHRRRSSRRYCC